MREARNSNFEDVVSAVVLAALATGSSASASPPAQPTSAEAQAAILNAEGQAKAIDTVFRAIHEGDADPKLLAYQYLQVLPQIAQGDANKMWIVPSEFSKALEGLAKLTGGDDEGEKPSWLAATSTGGPNGGALDLDTSRWFDSNLPPAAEQPEAMNLRASDDDMETRQAHTGMVPPSVLRTDMPASVARAGDEIDPDSAAAHAQQPPPYLQQPPPPGEGGAH